MKPTARDLIGAARRQEASDGRRAGGLPAGLRVRVARGIGAPRLAAIGLGAVGSSVYFVLGVVAKRSLGLTPIVFVVATAFFAITTMTYLEGTSVHQERGGSSAFARYAFDELVSFIAGWAVLLDYLIVMAIGSFAVSHYLGAFWGKADNFPFGDLVATGVEPIRSPCGSSLCRRGPQPRRRDYARAGAITRVP